MMRPVQCPGVDDHACKQEKKITGGGYPKIFSTWSLLGRKKQTMGSSPALTVIILMISTNDKQTTGRGSTCVYYTGG
jgi:hypothetical protein